MGYISLPSILNVIVGITSYYCVIQKIVILHDEIKTIQNVFFLLSLKKEQKILFLFSKTRFVQDKPKKQLFSKKKQAGFSQPWWVIHLEVHLYRLWAAST